MSYCEFCGERYDQTTDATTSKHLCSKCKKAMINGKLAESDGPSSSSPSSIQRQQKCTNCVIGYFDDDCSNSEIRENDKYHYPEDDTIFYKYCPHCGNENLPIE